MNIEFEKLLIKEEKKRHVQTRRKKKQCGNFFKKNFIYVCLHIVFVTLPTEMRLLDNIFL